MTHKIIGVNVEKYAYHVNKLRQNVGLETWKWRQIVTSQRTPNANDHLMNLNQNTPMKIFCVRHWLATHRFTLLVKSLQWNRNIQCRRSCRQIHTLFELFGAAFLFIWCGNGVPTPLHLALHPYTWPLQPIVFKWRQNSPSRGFASWSRIDTTWMRCATLDLAHKQKVWHTLQAWHIA